jgi:hypothetical protein
MKTGFTIVTLVWKLLFADATLKSMINGGIYKHKRPDGSNKQDIVVNSIAIDNDQLQTGVANINFHCPNLSLNVTDQPTSTLPNSELLETVTNRIIQIIKDHHDEEFSCDIQSHTDSEDDELKETTSNIRLIVHSVNL